MVIDIFFLGLHENVKGREIKIGDVEWVIQGMMGFKGFSLLQEMKFFFR